MDLDNKYFEFLLFIFDTLNSNNLTKDVAGHLLSLIKSKFSPNDITSPFKDSEIIKKYIFGQEKSFPILPKNILFNYFNSLSKCQPSLSECFVELLRGRHFELKSKLYHPFNESELNLHSKSLSRTKDDYIMNKYRSLRLDHHVLGHKSAIYCLCFDKTGKNLITGSDDHTIKIWSFDECINFSDNSQLRPPILKHTLRGHLTNIIDLSISKDNHLLASIDLDNAMILWCMKTGQPLVSFIGALENRTTNGICLVTCDEDRIKDNYTRGYIVVSTQGLGIFSIPYVHLRTCPLSASDEHCSAKAKCCQVILFDSNHFSQEISSSFDISPAGSLVVGGTETGDIKVFKLSNFGMDVERIDCLKGIHKFAVDNISVSPNELNIVSACHKDNTMVFWTLNRGKKSFDTAEENNNRLWNGSKLFLARKPKSQSCLIGWSNEARYLFVSFRSGIINLYNGTNGNFHGVLNGHDAQVNALSASLIDEKILISGGFDGKIITWNLEKREMINYFKYPGASLTTAGGLIWIDDADSSDEIKNAQKITGLLNVPEHLGVGFVAITKAGLISYFNHDITRAEKESKETERMADEQFFHWEFDNAQVIHNQRVSNNFAISSNLLGDLSLPTNPGDFSNWLNDKSRSALCEISRETRFPSSFCYRTLFSTNSANQSRQPRHDSSSSQLDVQRNPLVEIAPFQDLEEYKRNGSVTFEVVHALSQVPFSLLPPGYLVDIRGNPYDYERQMRQVIGRETLNRIVDLTPTITFDETSFVQVVDDIHFSRSALPSGYPFNPRSFRGVSPTENKLYLWQSVWTKDEYSLLSQKGADELKECLEEIREDLVNELKLLSRAESFIEKRKNTVKGLTKEPQVEAINETTNNQNSISVFDPTFEEPEVSSDSSDEWNRGDSVDYDCWTNRKKRRGRQQEQNTSEPENPTFTSPTTNQASSDESCSDSSSSSSNDSSQYSSNSSKSSQNEVHESQDENKPMRRSKRQKKLKHLRKKERHIPVFKSSQENSQDVPDRVEINRRELIKLRIMCNLDYANLFNKCLPLETPPLGGFTGLQEDTASKSEEDSLREIRMTRNRARSLNVEDSQDNNTEESGEEKLIPDWQEKVIWSGPDLDWLSSTAPQHQPYFPQLKDRVMFIQQGYKSYLSTFWNAGIIDPIHSPSPPKELLKILNLFPGVGGIVKSFEETIPDELPLPWDLNVIPHIVECTVELINFTFYRRSNVKRTALRNQRWKRHDRYIQSRQNQPGTSSNSMADYAYMNLDKFENEVHQMTNSFLRIVTLKLKRVDNDQCFLIRFHQDNENPCHFILLNEAYAVSMNRQWNNGDIIQSGRGEKISKAEILASNDPTRDPWLSIKVRWLSDEVEAWLSPWEVFPFNEALLKKNQIIEEEQLLNIHGSLDTMASGQSTSLDSPKLGTLEMTRLVECFTIILNSEKFDEFRDPVDLSLYPDYLVMSPYLIDLSLIINRLQTAFYRKKDAILFDIIMLARNVLSYNRPQSQISRKAIILSNLCIKITLDPLKEAIFAETFLENMPTEHISERVMNNLILEKIESTNGSTITNSDTHTEPAIKHLRSDSDSETFDTANCIKDEQKENEDPESPIYRTRSKRVNYADLEDDEDDVVVCGKGAKKNSLSSTSSREMNPRRNKKLIESPLYNTRASRRTPQSIDTSWKKGALNLLRELMNEPQSELFLDPVDPDEYPDYHEIISRPMNLREIFNRLSRPHNRIDNPDEFIDLLNLVVTNCRTYNTTPGTKVLEDCDWLEETINTDILPVIMADNGPLQEAGTRATRRKIKTREKKAAEKSDENYSEASEEKEDSPSSSDEDSDVNKAFIASSDEDYAHGSKYRLRTKKEPETIRTSSGRVIKRTSRDLIYEHATNASKRQRPTRSATKNRRVVTKFSSDSSYSPPSKRTQRQNYATENDSDYETPSRSSRRTSRR